MVHHSPYLRSGSKYITTFDAPVVGYTSANSINPVGEITGFYVDTSGVTFHGFLRTVSEPV